MSFEEQKEDKKPGGYSKGKDTTRNKRQRGQTPVGNSDPLRLCRLLKPNGKVCNGNLALHCKPPGS